MRKPYLLNKFPASILTLFLITYILLLPATTRAIAQPGPSTDLSRTKSIAAAQHEIVMLLLEKNEYEKAVTEANMIFALNWPEDQEPLLLKELLILSNQFIIHDQALLGLQFIEANEKFFKQISSRATILKEKGYLYKKLNRNDMALEFFKQARDLEKKALQQDGAAE